MTPRELNIRHCWLDELRPVAEIRIESWTAHLQAMPLIRSGAIAHQLSEQPPDIVVSMLAVLLKERSGKPKEPAYEDTEVSKC
jgi:hypothetical protein